ncbi:hypothetical protein FA046_00500 [Pedobacter cryophilus]|uniref:Uncharacterized protein n=2 Tax=Pedobacter cryophilus TaxID=2571271 RepID=A0A4U1C582_9SPHI|nr:hypothetical protein FA046_00500 [Pedobacter cryophilus]
MEWIIGIIVTVIIALVPYFKSKYFSRPEITIEVISDGGISSPMWLSNNNDFSDGFVDDRTAIRIFELKWKFKIVLRNNSDLTAFYPELDFYSIGQDFMKIEKINRLQPIKSAETLTLKAEYKEFEETTGDKRTRIGENRPSEFENLSILLSYENSKKRRFYTIFNYSSKTEKNKFLNEIPKEFKIIKNQ